MARKHKHEEHENHERWVISYADMVTLLFALFVVLYALGEVKLSKLKKVQQSLQFAFHFEGHGKTYQEGLHDRGDVGGDLLDAALLVNPQKGPMKEFLLQTLPEEFERITGMSIDVELQNDSMRFSGPLSGFFAPGQKRIRNDVHDWLTTLVEKAHGVASKMRIHIRTPRVVLGRYGDKTPYYSRDLCLERLAYLQQLVGLMSQIMEHEVKIELDLMPAQAESTERWEDEAQIAFYFTNAEDG